ncbi:ABC transporter permease [Gordonia caeni]|uniref:Membrane protein n=1 Tax=Gordonia caeni TaxID=1007097 RepID=A0ABP7PDF1_9ACTN
MAAVPVRKVAALIVGLAVLIPLILLMFIGPASRGAPHDVPIGLAGPAPAVAQATGMLEQGQPGAFEVHRYDDAAALQAATADREVYGGLALGPDPVTVVATGASPVVATTLTQLGARAGGPQTRVLDVAPPAESDPRGAGFGSMILPVFMAGAVLGIALTQLLRRVRLIAIALPVGAAVVGATSIGVAMAAGVLSGGFWAQWLAMSAGIFSIAAVVAGLVSLIGLAGMGVAALLFMLVGMPLSGISMPPEYLPWIWGEVGQWFPLGATASALRGAAFFADGTFPGTGTGMAYAALAMWIVVGYLLLGLAVLKRRRLTADVLASRSEPAAA